jgi:hypothetical protein
MDGDGQPRNRFEPKETTMHRTIPALMTTLAVACGAALAIAAPALAAEEASASSAGSASVRASADDAQPRPWGYVTFRSERYGLSDRAIVSTSPTTIRIADDSAATKNGGRTSLYVQLGYSLDPMKPDTIRISSGIAIRGYDFGSGTYDKSQAIQLGNGTLSLDSGNWSEATHAWGHLNSPNERGVDLDVHGIHLPTAS